jgi:serine/threonine protein phosphatase PrpC/cell division protein FtsW (lipid II flippase)/cell division protein FtsI/penicillin-binding protein 2
MNLTVCGKSDPGRKRAHNEDALIANRLWDDAHWLLVVIDGVGGQAGGEVAAELARTTIDEYMQRFSHGERLYLLKQAVTEANNRIVEARHRCADYSEMGCVLTACLFDLERSRLHLVHVGDTRLYCYADDRLQKLSHDHSWVGPYEENGTFTEEQAMNHPRRNVITRALGQALHDVEDEEFLEARTFPLTTDATYLLCSDGLYDMLTTAETEAVLATPQPLDRQTDQLIARANEKGGKDNITVILARTQPSALAAIPPRMNDDTLISPNMNQKPETAAAAPPSHRIERMALLLVTLLLLLGFVTLHNRRERYFDTVEKRYAAKQAINLDLRENKHLAVDLAELLSAGNYIPFPQDASTIARHIAAELAADGPMANLGELNKSRFFLTVSQLDNDSLSGTGLKARIARSRLLLQWSDTATLAALYRTHPSAVVDVGSGDCEIVVTILNRDKKPVTDGTLVQLKEYWNIPPDSLQRNDKAETDSILAYAQTDATGTARFRGLQANRYYSVLPVKLNCEYGASRGTTAATAERGLKEPSTHYTFTERAHRIRPFDSATYQQLKADGALTVHTPQAYRDLFLQWVICFFVGWWLLHFILSVAKKRTDPLLLPLLMMLTGIGVLTMYAIHDPLTDMPAGNHMAMGVLAGLAICLVCAFIRFDKFFDNKYLFKFDWLNACFRRIPPGFGYFVCASGLLLLLILFGSGPEGSGVKVNLFFFQPSEVIKLLCVIFLATYFARNADTIYQLSIRSDRSSWKHKLGLFLLIAGCLVLLVGGYLATGDMGPALVLGFTFILIYSMARRDFIRLVVGCATYCLCLLLVRYLHSSIYLTVSLVWLLGWLLYGWFYKSRKQVYESAIFINMVIAMFVFGGGMLSDSLGQRLHDRTAISLFGDRGSESVWNNEVTGGDQIAQGLWGFATGGLTGQGLGEGNPNVIPAFHTDMVLAGIGEEMGWIGLLLVVVCFTLLIHRAWIIGRRAAKGFLFYLATGIALSTGIQFLVISLGCLGIIPLTGITVPFLSNGAVSVIVCMAAFGVVLSISQEEGAAALREKIAEKYDNRVTLPVIVAWFAFSLFLLGYLFYYQVVRQNDILIKPALVTNQNGERIAEYNPRINLLVRRLGAADIYDRYGEVLATGRADSLRIGERRHYPYGNNLIFWTGDANHTASPLWSEARGYVAERRHLSTLRGFNNRTLNEQGESEKFYLPTDKYRINRFLPEQSKRYVYERYDYSELIPALKAGEEGREIEKLRAKQQPVHLTVDAQLQTSLQQTMANFFSAANYERMRKLRASVVVLGARSGELLASANYPLPDVDTLRVMPEVYNDIEGTRGYAQFTHAYTDMDLGICFPTAPGSTAKVLSAMAGFMKLGRSAADSVYNVNPQEAIYRKAPGEPGYDRTKRVTMREAIVESSNIYFIKLVNRADLYEQLKTIYLATGVQLAGILPYTYNNTDNELLRSEFSDYVAETRERALDKFATYWKESQAGKYRIMRDGDWAWAWGQGKMAATPLAMARAYSVIANEGKLTETRYEKGETAQHIPIAPAEDMPLLYNYMVEEAKAKRVDGIAAKTGTPERDTRVIGPKAGRDQNDGWFVFIRESAAYKEPLVVAIRIERLDVGGSMRAVYLAREVIRAIELRERAIEK